MLPFNAGIDNKPGEHPGIHWLNLPGRYLHYKLRHLELPEVYFDKNLI